MSPTRPGCRVESNRFRRSALASVRSAGSTPRRHAHGDRVGHHLGAQLGDKALRDGLGRGLRVGAVPQQDAGVVRHLVAVGDVLVVCGVGGRAGRGAGGGRWVGLLVLQARVGGRRPVRVAVLDGRVVVVLLPLASPPPSAALVVLLVVVLVILIVVVVLAEVAARVIAAREAAAAAAAAVVLAVRVGLGDRVL